MLFSFVASIFSILSFLKVVQKRRQLQIQNNERIGFFEKIKNLGLLTAATHAVFDGIEKITTELDKMNEIIEERSNRLLIEPKKRFLLTTNPPPILRIQSSVKGQNNKDDEMLKSIPNFNLN
jgi:hypothetical protein